MSTYVNSKKYSGVQHYIKADGTKSYSIRYKDEYGKTKRVQVGNDTDGITEVYCKNKRIEILNAQNLGRAATKDCKESS
ncbi:MAG: hypothetical protein Q9M43_14750 [Sulfurimonas sp.]|nr:hypothetical protein [Sulfurimonas sp.]